MRRNWIAVASAEHVARGRAAGFMQVCHGKAAPLRRIRPGDRVVYYSPTGRFGGRDRLRAFTALGVVRSGEPYAAERGDGFRPFRHDVAWLTARAAPIGPLLPALDFATGTASWGARLRFGLLEIGDRDLERIAAAMGARLP
jgi:hypothetical protein